VIQDGAVLVRDGRIEKVGSRRAVARRGLETLDAEGNLICPGFIDLQVNGGGDALLTEDADYESVCKIAKTHSSFGTTSLMPTVMTAHEKQIRKALSAVSEAVHRGTGTASVIGSHLEGPFINEKKRGIHDQRFLLPPSIDHFSSFNDASQGTLRLLTLAPELPNSLAVIELAVSMDVAVAIGHTTARLPEVERAVSAGATIATHVFNAMEGLGTRDPGTVGAILTIDKLYAGLIADGIHVHPTSMEVCIRAREWIECSLLLTPCLQ
jgi:N-acetylglucosamine-6-phosphate deacetylase